MPLYPDDQIPETPKVTRPDPITETATVYEDQTIEETNRPMQVTELEGAPWTVTWYGNVLGKDDYPTRLDFALDPSLQQYVRINGLILKYTDPLNPDQDDNVIMTVSGQANVYPGVNPNQWDMFVARTKEGRIGLFTVTELPRPLTYMAYTAHQIQYELVGYVDDMTQRDLNRKVVKELYFNEDNPLCPTENMADIIDRKLVIKRFIKYMDLYYSFFYSRLESTFLLDDEGIKIYDDAVTEFFNTLIPLKARNKTRHPIATRYSVPSNHYQEKSKTIFDVLHDNEDTMLDYVDKEYALPDTYDFFSSFVMHSILMTPINKAVIPFQMSSLAGNHENQGFYVFSEEFYDRVPTKSFEQLVLALLCREAKSFDEIDTQIDIAFKESTTKEKFYLIPIFLWMYLRFL